MDLTTYSWNPIQFVFMRQLEHQSDKAASLRSQKLESLRMSLKMIPLMTQKTQHIKHQLSLRRENTRAESESSPEDVDSFSGRLSEDEDIFKDNSFLDKYDLLEKIGEGGNGCVYKCQHKINLKLYAAKKFCVEREHILELKKSFIIMKELKHHSICHYKALYFDKNQRVAYLIMEYLPLPSLADYKPASEKELKFIVKEIITAIAYLHNRNICHRDIKPENILYDTKTKQVKLIDFGISKKTFLRGVRRDMLTIIGTHFYLAPEVFIGGGYDERVDLWALGVTVYRLITGYTPFESEYHSDTVTNILKGQPQFDQKIWMNYNWFAKDFVTRLLKNKSQRMSAKQAGNHLWLQSAETDRRKLGRLVSHNILMSEDFHDEMRTNLNNARSKQEGSRQNERQHRLNKSINLISELEYDLQESDEEEAKVTRSVRLPSHSFKIKPSICSQVLPGKFTDVI